MLMEGEVMGVIVRLGVDEVPFKTMILKKIF
jgi:hypothetical protein